MYLIKFESPTKITYRSFYTVYNTLIQSLKGFYKNTLLSTQA